MGYLKRNIKRIATDAAGYTLLVAAALTGWLPGPGGIPLAIAGLGLLSINNKWARDLREYVLAHGGRFVEILFPKNKWAQWGYDLLVCLLFGLSALLAYRHAAVWQIGLSVSAFFLATFIALTNRERLQILKRKMRRNKNPEV